MWWLAALAAVWVTFGVGFCAGIVWRTRAHARSLDAALTEVAIRAALEPAPHYPQSAPSLN